MEFDYSKLLGKIKEVFGSQDEFAKTMEMSRSTISAALNNKREFTQQEMKTACELLSINEREIPVYFFTPKVQKAELKEGE